MTFEKQAGSESGKQGFHLGYRPALDGLRGVSILLVLFQHLELVNNHYNLAGFIGVDVFFVLSGFLITSLLLEEWEKRGKISLKSFFWRRALRLLPVLIVMLTAFVIYVILVHPRGWWRREFYETLRALLYFTNWATALRIGTTNFLGHTWSLSIEEQFYIIWPCVLIFLLRRGNRTSILSWVLLGAILSWLTRVALFLGGTQNLSGNVFDIDPARIIFGLDTRADSLLIGCAAGIIVSSNLLPKSRRLGLILRVASAISVIGLTLLGFTWWFDPWVCCVGWFFISVFAAFTIVRLVLEPRGVLGRILEFSPLVYIGKISYGLYLWHAPIFLAMHAHSPSWRIIALPMTLVVTLVSYYLIERPCLRFKRRFERIK